MSDNPFRDAHDVIVSQAVVQTAALAVMLNAACAILGVDGRAELVAFIRDTAEAMRKHAEPDSRPSQSPFGADFDLRRWSRAGRPACWTATRLI